MIMKDFNYMQAFKEKQVEIKEKYGDAIILFRVSDLYMAVDEDASACGRVLGISVSVCGAVGVRSSAFPNHCLDVYLPKLIRAGHRICICENPWH